jgi:glycosyltransferase involved in cell wall biosynthesis
VAQEKEAPIRILRVIARMNLGGPAHHVALLSEGLDSKRYETLLVCGEVGRGEEEHTGHDVPVQRISTLGPDIRPLQDIRALYRLIRLIRSFQPAIVETHTAKAGMLGRTAARFARRRRRPVVIHTYHGHVLQGYFGPLRTRFFTMLERALARISDLLICVSSATRDELVELGVAPRSKFAVVPLGLDLEPFLSLRLTPDLPFREEIRARAEDVVFTYTGRLVPIKRPDLMLRAIALAREEGNPVRLAVVGDGLLRPQLEDLARELGCEDAVTFLGYRRDLVHIAAGSDAALLTSDNEGTPVALIEAGAAGRPAVSTRVGGVSDIVVDGTGLLAPPGDARAVAGQIGSLCADAALRRRMGARAREHVSSRFTKARLLSDIDELYTQLLAAGTVAK